MEPSRIESGHLNSILNNLNDKFSKINGADHQNLHHQEHRGCFQWLKRLFQALGEQGV